jgi:CheY-like chemotaxis protein
MQEERDRCLRVGMDNFLAKPFTPERLQEIICQTLSTGTGLLDSETPQD